MRPTSIRPSRRGPRLLGAVVCLVLAIGCDSTSAPDGGPGFKSVEPGGPSLSSAPAGGSRIAGRYIVTLQAKANASEVAQAHGIDPSFTYTRALNGFAGSVSDAARAGLLRDARVVRVDPDHVIQETGGGAQSPAPWGLDRIDQRAALDGKYSYPGTGRGVTAYILDTGIRYSHSDFNGRAAFGFDAFGGNGSDCRGHGTHVAGTVGGATWGVAKEVALVSVRVLDCAGSGTTSGVLAGLDWTIAHAARPAVVNLSLGGSADDALDAGVRNTIAAGIPVVVAAGNDARDACGYSPSRVVEAMTVGASDSLDTKPYFSNWGPCVDWYAPGVRTRSAYNTSDTATAVLNGTSMSAPHTTGVVALYLAVQPGASPAELAAAISAAATQDAVIWQVPIGDLLYAGGVSSTPDSSTPVSSPPPPSNTAPSADYTVACDGSACAFADLSSDADGVLAAWTWDFGDGSVGTGRNPSHTYASGDTYRVTLVVTDDAGATAAASHDIPVGVVLTLERRKVKGRTSADLSWRGAATAEVSIIVNGSIVATTANTGSYTYRPTSRGQGTYTFKVCEVSTAPACSREESATL